MNERGGRKGQRTKVQCWPHPYGPSIGVMMALYRCDDGLKGSSFNRSGRRAHVMDSRQYGLVLSQEVPGTQKC